MFFYESEELPAMSDSRLLELSHSCCLAPFVFIFTFSSGHHVLFICFISIVWGRSLCIRMEMWRVGNDIMISTHDWLSEGKGHALPNASNEEKNMG